MGRAAPSHALHHLASVLRTLGIPRPAAGPADHSGRSHGTPRDDRRDPIRAQGARGRARRVHFRGRIGHPHRQPAAVQARDGEDRQGAGPSRDPGPSGPRVGQHLQLRGRAVFREDAAPLALSCHRVLRRPAAYPRHRLGRPASRPGTGKRCGAIDPGTRARPCPRASFARRAETGASSPWPIPPAAS